MKTHRPDDKLVIHSVLIGGSRETAETNAEITLGGLTAEVLRDLARNESVSKEWRKAAIKFLMARNHGYQHHAEFKELKEEILNEQQAEEEVKDVVEAAIEHPLD